ncbi:type II toxin-antitoxin system VapC family toxin [Actinomyces minihominis]|uniref:type II toxin-antitoxin system VapC family toxin n=1 Tax=Actinomyces minihominis TaxID=2002838 RepID=UPI000C088AE7|nr:type II toxin-antitoxin system VapC family toxin [Actinomyces minihominis]
MTSLTYIDTSAFVKLLKEEDESAALLSWLRTEKQRLVTSDLTTTELLRVCLRCVPHRLAVAHSLLSAVTRLPVSSTVLRTAAVLAPSTLRYLDAVHLATAL